MKRKIALSIGLALSVGFVSLMSSDRAALAQPQNLIKEGTGTLVLGIDQKLRIMTEWTSPGAVTVRFRRIEYGPGACSDGACKHTVASLTDFGPINLTTGEAASFDTPASYTGTTTVASGVVESSRRGVRSTAMIIDVPTGKVVSVFHLNDL